MDDLKRDKLEAFMSQIQAHDLDRLASAVELDRVSGGTELPHETLLDVMRPALRDHEQHSRIPTPERLFCTAFEDLLNALPNRRKQSGRISRTSIRPMWIWLKETLLKDELPNLEAQIGALIAEGQMDEVAKIICDLQMVAGQMMRKYLLKAVQNEGEFEMLCNDLGGALVVADLHDMAMCLEAADWIGRIQANFEKPLLGFAEDDVRASHDFYLEMRAEMPDHSQYALLTLMGRMARPWEILSLISSLEKDYEGFSISRQDQAAVNDLLLDDVDITGLTLVGLQPDNVDIKKLLENLNLFVQITGGVVRGVGLQKDEGWGQRFRTTREAVAQQMGAFVEALPAQILKSLPVKKIGGFGVRIPRVPDTSVAPTAYAVNVSVDLTKLFAELRFYADQTGFSAAYSRAAGEFDHSYELFKNDILDHIRATSGRERQNAEAFAEVLAQIGEEYRGPVEADMIRRRSATAAEEGVIVTELASGQ
jgi:hypothetical protein